MVTKTTEKTAMKMMKKTHFLAKMTDGSKDDNEDDRKDDAF